MELFDIILKPVISEKATSLEKEGKYVLLVRKNATKIEVAQAIKKLYGTEVLKVNVLRTHRKVRGGGRSRHPVIKKRAYKKVIITTKAKKAINLTKPNLKI